MLCSFWTNLSKQSIRVTFSFLSLLFFSVSFDSSVSLAFASFASFLEACIYRGVSPKVATRRRPPPASNGDHEHRRKSSRRTDGPHGCCQYPTIAQHHALPFNRNKQASLRALVLALFGENIFMLSETRMCVVRVAPGDTVGGDG